MISGVSNRITDNAVVIRAVTMLVVVKLMRLFLALIF